jgi:hypothetical protein
MAKKVKTEGAAPVSKYAMKKMARANALKEEEQSVENTTVVEDNTSFEKPVVDKTNKGSKFVKKRKPALPPAASNYPEHVVNIAVMIKNNAEIRRYTSLAILNYLTQTGAIKGNSKYVSFKWNKFAVKCDGLMREYSYTEPFFINALIASFTSFANSAQKVITIFCKKEMSVGIDKAGDAEEIQAMIASNEEHQNELIDDDEEDNE